MQRISPAGTMKEFRVGFQGTVAMFFHAVKSKRRDLPGLSLRLWWSAK